MSSRSDDRAYRSHGSAGLLGTRYALALAVLIALTISSFLLMRGFVVDERALDDTMSAIHDLQVELATQQITMRDLVAELRGAEPDELRLRGLKRALVGSRERTIVQRGKLGRAMHNSAVRPAAWAILREPPYSLDEILSDMASDVRTATRDASVREDDGDAVLADPSQDGFLDITDSHATAARLASERLLGVLRAETEARKVSREEMHAWLGWATVLVLIGEALIIFWPLIGNLGREERRAAEAQTELARLARHDALTGLLNRASLIATAERALADADPDDDRLAVMLIDLDRFKPINDMFGHAAGDGVLVEVARRLQAALRPGDVVARLGGDEFVVMLPKVRGAVEVREIGLRINRALGRAMEIEGHRFDLGASIGCAFWPADARDVDGLLSAADLAMYRAKRSDRDDPVFFDEKLRSDVARVRSEEADLRRAIADDELLLHYQPIVSRGGDAFHGFEALVRWNHPLLGTIDPDHFLPTAERAGLMSQITTWVLERACRQHADWAAAGLAPGSMSVNVADAFLTQPDAIERIATIAERHGVAHDALVLEVSQRVLGEDERAPISRQITAAHAAGLRIAVDEFGLDRTSLTSLRKPEIGILKIDRAFVRDLASAPENAAVVGTMIELARILDKQVVIEGVETAEQATLLAVTERAWVQGFLYSRPLEPARAADFLARRRDEAAAAARRAGA